jgi:hypothetical protein
MLSRTSGLLLALGLALVITLSACDPAPEQSASAVEGLAGARPVMQITTGGGMVGYAIGNPPGITDLILWEDGRLVFRSDGSFLETKLEATAVAELLQAADPLYALDDYVSLFRYVVTDAPYTRFTVEATPGSRKTVKVYGMARRALEGEWPPESDLYDGIYDPSQSGTVAELRGLWQMIMDSLPETASPMRTDEVVVTLSPLGADFESRCTEEELEELLEWPPELSGLLQEDEAQEAILLGGLGPKRPYWIEGETYSVEVVPVLPILHETQWRWERPRHPEATRYNIDDADYGSTYRYSGVSQEEMASWYREAMADYGWNLAQEEGTDLQIWVTPKYGGSILELRFRPNSLFMKQIFVENDVPHHPRRILGGCEGFWCQLLRDATLDEAEAWFDEYMGYLGWHVESPGTYYRMDGQTKVLLRLGFRMEDGGTAVTIEENSRIPPAWWPTPTGTPWPEPTPTPDHSGESWWPLPTDTPPPAATPLPTSTLWPELTPTPTPAPLGE